MNIRNISISKAVFLLLFFLFSAGYAGAQSGEAVLKGTVKDVYGHALSEASIRSRDGRIDCTSGEDGSYSITRGYVEGMKLYVSREGYRTEEVTVDGIGDLDVVLKADVSGRDDATWLLTGSRPMSTVGASTYTITAEELSRTKTTSLGTALTGRIPGLSSGYIRGISTTNGKTPTIMVDGMVSDGYGYLNMNDVESVTILKDAAATSLYGFQGGNGIIMVRTKRGYSGKSKITVDANYTLDVPMVTPTVLSSAQHARLYNEAWYNDGNTQPSIYTDEDIANYASGENRELYPNNNWYGMYIKPLVQTQNVHVSSRGGSDIFKYYVGLGYLHQDSPYVTDGTVPEKFGTNRFDVRSNLDLRINDVISGYMYLLARVNRSRGPKAGDIYSTIFNLDPTVYGPVTPEIKGPDGEVITPGGKIVVTETDQNNIYAKINRGGYVQTTGVNVSSITGLNFDFGKWVPGLAASAEFKYYTSPTSSVYGNTDYERYIRDITVKDELVFNRYGTTRDEPVTFTKGTSNSYRMEYQGNVRYSNTFGDHGVGANAMIQYQYYNPTSAVGVQPFIRMTYGINLSYSFRNQLFADFSGGYQGSEQFAPGRRYGFFPSGSLAYVMSNADFLRGNNVVTFLKLKGSYGLVGNDDISGKRFLYKDDLTTNNSIITENLLGNPFVTWETSRIANVGFDLGLWDQLSLSFEYFDNYRSNILITSQNYPNMFGIPSSVLPLTNDGEVHSKGFEATVGYRRDFGGDFSFGVDGFFAFRDNRIIDIEELYLGDDYKYPYRNTGYRVGQQWGYLIDYSNGNGYFNSVEEIAASGLEYEGKAPRPGDFIYRDLNGDGRIDQKDMAPMGYSNIPRISYGCELNFRWKGLSLSALLWGVAQANRFNSGVGFYESYSQGTFFTQHLNAWTPERYANGDRITAPALSLNGSSSHRANDYYFQDLSYLQLREVTLEYELPERVTRKWGQGASVYFSGRNLLLFDNMKSGDMNVLMGSVNSAPAKMAFVLGLKLMF